MARAHAHRPGRRRRQAGGGKASAERGSTFEAQARDLTSDGRAVVVHPDGRTFFCWGLWPGERARLRVEGRRGRVGLARVVERLQAVADRVEPRCPHHGFEAGDCGGCPWQFVDYAAQLAAKQARVARALDGLGPVRLEPVRAAPEPFGYRNRAQLRTDGAQIGYVSPGSRQLAPISRCPVLTPANQRTLTELLARLPNPHWSAPRPQSWVTLNLDESTDADQVRVGGRLPFGQGNSAQNAFMRDWLAGALAAHDRAAPVLELFCGTGNFTATLVDSGFSAITAADASSESVARLRCRGWKAVDAVCLDLFDTQRLAELLRRVRPVGLLLDPPREGWKSRAVLGLSRPRPQWLLYVSCDLATFVRDAGELRGFGYRLQQVQPLDLFPQTPHVELLARFQLTGRRA